MTALDAAKKLQEWAGSFGLMYEQTSHQNSIYEIDTDDLFPNSAAELLRKKLIRNIGFNEARNEITIFTHRSIPNNKKTMSALPQEIEGIKIIYRQGAMSAVGTSLASPQTSAPWTNRQCLNAVHRYACGSSISIGNEKTAGTFCAIVKDGDGNLFGLSNNHVSGGCNYASKDMPILAPGVVDVCSGGVPPFTIGFHHASLNMSTGAPDQVDPKINLDASIFKIANLEAVTSYQGNSYDTPVAAIDLVANMEVEKVGRTTGSTKGRVISQLIGSIDVMYSAPQYNFSGKVYFEPMFAIVGYGDKFSDSGDSGSLITHINREGERVAVGIVVAGMDDSSAPGGKLTLALPIKSVLNSFNVSLVSGLNV